MGWTIVNNKSNISSSARKFRSSLRTHSSKISLFIQLFFCDLYSQGRCLTFLKQQRFLDFHITNIGSFSPTALAAAIPVSLTLPFFPLDTNNNFQRNVMSEKYKKHNLYQSLIIERS